MTTMMIATDERLRTPTAPDDSGRKALTEARSIRQCTIRMDKRIGAAFASSAKSDDVKLLLPDVEAAANAADAEAGEARARALDPLLSRADVKVARRQMEDAAFTRDRLREAGTKLVERVEALKSLEAERRSSAEHDRLIAERDRLAKEMEGMADALARVARILSQISIVDHEIRSLNIKARGQVSYIAPILSRAAPLIRELFEDALVGDAFINAARRWPLQAKQARTVEQPHLPRLEQRRKARVDRAPVAPGSLVGNTVAKRLGAPAASRGAGAKDKPHVAAKG